MTNMYLEIWKAFFIILPCAVVCRVSTVLGHTSVRDLRIGSHELIKMADTSLRELLEEMRSSNTGKTQNARDMCAQTLVERVLLPHADLSGASSLLAEFGGTLSDKVEKVKGHVGYLESRGYAGSICACKPCSVCFDESARPLVLFVDMSAVPQHHSQFLFVQETCLSPHGQSKFLHIQDLQQRVDATRKQEESVRRRRASVPTPSASTRCHGVPASTTGRKMAGPTSTLAGWFWGLFAPFLEGRFLAILLALTAVRFLTSGGANKCASRLCLLHACAQPDSLLLLVLRPV